MEQPSNKRFDPKTLIIGLLCALGAAASGHRLYEDFNQAGGAGRGAPMAKVERRESKVRRRAASTFTWNNVRADENLFKRDSVQTSESSGAAIRFNDGTVMELGENSLVVIDDITNLSLDFLKGSVVLHTSEGDKRVTVDKDGKAKLEEVAIRLIKPEPLARYFAREGEGKPIRFAWKPREGASVPPLPPSYSLQISPDRSFRPSRVKTVAVEKGLELDMTLPAGSYFWRLVSGDKALTDSGQFRVVQAVPLRPVWPVGGEKIVSFGEQVPVQFRWLNVEDIASAGQTEHELQIARDPEFKTLVANQTIAAASGLATLKDLPEGDLYWRVRSRYADLYVPSSTERFTIGKAQKPTLALIFPENKKTLDQAPQVRFAWSSDGNGLEYRWELQNAQGKEILSSKNAALGALWKKPDSGAYRWRVTAFHKSLPVAESPWHTFSVFEGSRMGLIAPSKDQEIYYWDKPKDFLFQWKTDDLAQRNPDYSYRVEVAREADFKNAMTGPQLKVTSLESAKLSLAPGSYFWRVTVVDPTGQTLKTSDSQRFAYGVFPPLPAPVPMGPQPQTVFNVVEDDKNPVVSWNEVKEAETYELILYSNEPARATAGATGAAKPAQPRVVFKTLTPKTSFEFKGLKPAGYQWTVRAIDRTKRPGQPLAPRPFSVTYGEVLQSPEIVSPEVQ